MKKFSLLFLFLLFLVRCQKKEFYVHPSLTSGTWIQNYIDYNVESKLFRVDNQTISFFDYSKFSDNYEIIDYSQVGSDFPIQITIVGKSKNKKNIIHEFKYTLISNDTLYESHGSPNYSSNYWYTKI